MYHIQSTFRASIAEGEVGPSDFCVTLVDLTFYYIEYIPVTLSKSSLDHIQLSLSRRLWKQAKPSSAAETTLKAVRRALDIDLRMSPNPLQEEVRMHAVYFTIISSFLFAMFVCAVVGIATTMTVTPVDSDDSNELRWSLSGLKVRRVL